MVVKSKHLSIEILGRDPLPIKHDLSCLHEPYLKSILAFSTRNLNLKIPFSDHGKHKQSDADRTSDSKFESNDDKTKKSIKKHDKRKSASSSEENSHGYADKREDKNNKKERETGGQKYKDSRSPSYDYTEESKEHVQSADKRKSVKLKTRSPEKDGRSLENSNVALKTKNGKQLDKKEGDSKKKTRTGKDPTDLKLKEKMERTHIPNRGIDTSKSKMGKTHLESKTARTNQEPRKNPKVTSTKAESRMTTEKTIQTAPSNVRNTPFLRTGKYAQIVKNLHLEISEETYIDIAANLPYFEKKYENMTDPPDLPTKALFSDMQIESEWSQEDSNEDLFAGSYFDNYTCRN